MRKTPATDLPQADALARDPLGARLRGLFSRKVRSAQEAARADLQEALLEKDPFFTVTRVKRKRRGLMGVWLLISLPLLGVAATFAVMAITHLPVSAPDWVIDRAEARINNAMEGLARVRIIGGADLLVDEGITPRLRLHAVELTRPSGMPIAAFPELRMTVWAAPLLLGRVEPRSFRISGARIAMRRLEDGRLDVGFGGDWAMSGVGPASVSEALEQFESVFETPALAQLERIEANDLELRLDDARLGRTWWVREGRFNLAQTARDISVDLGFDVGAQNALPAAASLSMSTRKDGPEARLGAQVRAVAARELALQSPALAFLSVLDAPISGAIAMQTDETGKMGPMRATLEIGEGALTPEGIAQPLPFNNGKVRLAYNPALQRVDIEDFSIDSRTLRLSAKATSHLGPIVNGLPRETVSQISINDLALDPEGMFETPARFTQGAADLRVSFSPFKVELGQLSLTGDSQQINMKGKAVAGEKGWEVALDTQLGAIDKADFLTFWPQNFKEKDRLWVTENIAEGRLQNAYAALRIAPEQDPKLALSYEFSDAKARVVKTLPLTENTRGFATIMDNSHRLMVETGDIPAPNGAGRVDVAGSTLIVPDIRIKPAPAEVRLRSKGEIPAILALLDEEPFRILTKANLGTDLASGQAEAVTDLDLVLKPKVLREEVRFRVRADLYDVQSDKIVKGKALTSDHLVLTADDAGIAIAGKGALNGVGFEARWAQNLARAAKGSSVVEGEVEVSTANLAKLGVTLPAGLMTGSGPADIRVDLKTGEVPRYAVDTSLAGIGLNLPQIGWQLGRNTTGKLALSGRLGAVPTVEAIALDAGGLAAQGALKIGSKGLESANFSSVKLGGWFSGAVALAGREVRINNGRVDLRNLPDSFASGAAGGSAGAAASGSRIIAKLDRVTVAQDLTLTGVAADLTTRGGLSGTFTSGVNGQSRVTGTLAPARAGGAKPAVRIGAQDAGAVIAAAGIFTKLSGGAMDLILEPIGAMYQGHVEIRDARVTGAPALASMLSAISGVGLVEQLNGEGLAFSDIVADFRISDKAVTISNGSAEGASLGVTLAGLYLPKSKTIDLQGVVSPFYLINGIGQVLTQRGEGLFGFNYTVKGPASAPETRVNPLSILAPGMLRELFRGKAPQAPSEAG
ncbi:AsmA-like C-terminal region-containing protein [Albirhodobacter sp. R86504]|uniref:AsmA-like C-terminal region-containing protein n=1 Tax=Albirhodobacter sp. R86504 TaxID=3093848 RepID=UPI0036708857